MALANRPDGCGSCHGFALGLVQKKRLPLFGPLNPLARKKCGETEAHSSTSPPLESVVENNEVGL